MSLKKFIKNLRYLFKYDLSKYTSETLYNNIINQILYEIPTSEINRPNIKNYEETINMLIDSNCSIARFGDGEITIINGKNIPFQNYDENLALKLKEILSNNNSKLLVGINYEYYYPHIDQLIPVVANFYRFQVSKLRNNLSAYINWNSQYYAAAFTQLYMFFKDYNFESYYEQLRKIWDKKRILLVTCQEAVQSIDYNIYDNASKIDYLYIPSKNAYTKYNEIYSSIKKYEKDTLIILMAGPTAKVLADDLSKENYRALDLGHLMKDYDWYKKSTDRNLNNVAKFMSPD